MTRGHLLPALAATALLALVASGCGDDDNSTENARTTTVNRTTTVAVPSPTQKLKRDNLTVYLSQAFQGISKPSAESIRNSAQLALEQAGARAGGMRVDLVALDDALQSTGLTDRGAIEQNARTAVTDPTAIAYIGDQGSGDTAFSLPITNAAGLLHVSATNTSPGLTQTGTLDKDAPGKFYPSGQRNYGRIVPTDKIQAGAQIALAKTLNCRAIGVLNDGGVFGSGLAQQLVAQGRAGGVTLGRQATIDLAKTDGSAGIRTVATGAPDCVIYAGSAGENVIALWGRLHAALPNARLIGPDALANAEFALRIGSAGPLTYLTTPTLASKYFNEAGQDFLSTYGIRFGGVPDPSGIYGYETMRAVLAAINAAGREPTRAQVVAQWFALRNRQSSLGSYSISATGDSTLTTFGAYRVVDQALVFYRVLDSREGAANTSG
ncbi:hypothetical protein DSM112329_05123 [Paraconexibacter sp. AEG42_29]|uniref:Leucine-binding protein domain-containing protein n=1 Tax=Paraconexibacter sp. AEG42_29 TaxID=2997339 RepID=A0AAU7B2Y0_9ACTN